LIRKMKRANPLWGAPRIHGELLKLGIEVSERTVSRWLPRLRKPPSQSWRTFLANHVEDLVSLDFFTAPTLDFRILFVFIVVAHERRRVVHFNVTSNPTALWTAPKDARSFPSDNSVSKSSPFSGNIPSPCHTPIRRWVVHRPPPTGTNPNHGTNTHLQQDKLVIFPYSHNDICHLTPD
jgi:hypothetical protein